MRLKYLYISVISVLLFSFSACQPDLNMTSTKPNTQHPSEVLMRGVLTTAYNTLTVDRGGYGYALWGAINGCDTDESYFYSTNNSDATTPGLHNINSSQTAYVQESWRDFYEIIECCNIVIDMGKTVDMDAAIKADLIGQAKTLRAFAHFMLAVHYGPVPIKNIPTEQMTNLDLPRNSIADVCAFAVKELREAVPMLTEISAKQTTTYITKPVAEGLSQRVGLFMASHPAIQQTAMYDSVAVWGKKLIDRGVRSLNTSTFTEATAAGSTSLPAYAKVFVNNMKDDVTLTSNNEAIWDCAFFIKSNINGSYATWNSSYVNYLGSYMGVNCPDPSYTSSPIGYSINTTSFRPQATLWKKYEKGDLRRDWNISTYSYRTSAKDPVTGYIPKSYYLSPDLSALGTPTTPAKLLFVVKGEKLVNETVIENPGVGYTNGTFTVKVDGYANSTGSTGTFPWVTTGTVSKTPATSTTFSVVVSGGSITSVTLTGTSQAGYMNPYSRGIGKWRREFEIIPTNLSTTREQYLTSCNFPILRYADVLLMTAEAALFNTGSAGGATKTDGLGYVNLVRNRAGLANIADYDLPYIQDERSRELCFEGVRRMDLLRWGYDKYNKVYQEILADVVLYGSDGAGSYKNDASVNSGGNNDPRPVYAIKALMSNYEKYSLLPIPLNELARASNTFYQNKGW